MRAFHDGPPGQLSTTTARGREAESLVAAWLESRGYILLGRNVRVGHDEIDLLALDGRCLVLFEVRSRKRGSMVHPLESITSAKRRRLRRLALYQSSARNVPEVRIDIVTVVHGEIDPLESAVDFSET